MANEVATFDPSVPAFLRKAAFQNVGVSAMAGIDSFPRPYRISIRGARFHLQDNSGNETDSVEHNGTALDVIVVGANEVVSKLYYPGAWDPNTAEAQAPTCFSDNGQAPSERAATPQSPTCAACPHNAWGSKVTPQGSQVKACADIKKMAVLLASDVEGPVYQLPIPAASLKGWAAVCKHIVDRGFPVGAFIFRVNFDTTASYPKLMFVPQSFITEDMASVVEGLYGTDEVALAIGSNDKPRTAALPAPAAAAPAVARPQPLPSTFVPPAPVILPTAQQGQTIPAQTNGAAEPPKRRRGRPSKADAPVVEQPQPVAAAPVQAPAGMPAHTAQAMTPMPAIPQNLVRGPAPVQPVAAVVQPASRELDDMLAKALSLPV